MRITGFIFLGLFLIASIIHLFFCYQEKEKQRAITKPICLALLGTGVAFLIPQYPLVYIGAYCGLLGDIFLLKKKDPIMFMAGGLSFTAGHILYFIQIVQLYSFCIPFYAYIFLVAVIALITLLLYKKLKNIFGDVVVFGLPYLLLLLTLLCLGITLSATSNNHWPGACIAIGYFLFFCSDCLLGFTNFKQDIKRRDFYIMITYLSAEFCILIGFVLFLI